MKFLVFDTEEEALEAEAAIALSIGCSKIGMNAKTGEPEPEKQTTDRWSIPQETLSGKWVFPSPDDTGIDYNPDWFPAENGEQD